LAFSRSVSARLSVGPGLFGETCTTTVPGLVADVVIASLSWLTDFLRGSMASITYPLDWMVPAPAKTVPEPNDAPFLSPRPGTDR